VLEGAVSSPENGSVLLPATFLLLVGGKGGIPGLVSMVTAGLSEVIKK